MSNTPARPCTTTALLWQNSLSWISTPSTTCLSTGLLPLVVCNRLSRRYYLAVHGDGQPQPLLRLQDASHRLLTDLVQSAPGGPPPPGARLVQPVPVSA